MLQLLQKENKIRDSLLSVIQMMHRIRNIVSDSSVFFIGHAVTHKATFCYVAPFSNINTGEQIQTRL